MSEGQARTYYVHPFASVFDRRKYFTLPPFVHHGAPLYRNNKLTGNTRFRARATPAARSAWRRQAGGTRA